MYQELWIVFIFEFCIFVASQEQKQRTASLIVLPPLVLGYDELYEENSPEKKDKLKQKDTANQNQPKLGGQKNEPIVKDGKPNVKRSDVRFDREGHKLNFAGHFLLPHDEKNCPFHDGPDHKMEILDLNVNRRSQGNRNLGRNLRNLVKNNLLKSLVNPRQKLMDDKGNLVVLGNVALGGPKPKNKGKPNKNIKPKIKGDIKPTNFVKATKKEDNKAEQNASRRVLGPIESNVTKDMIKELAVGMLTGILLNQ